MGAAMILNALRHSRFVLTRGLLRMLRIAPRPCAYCKTCWRELDFDFRRPWCPSCEPSKPQLSEDEAHAFRTATEQAVIAAYLKAHPEEAHAQVDEDVIAEDESEVTA